MNSDVTNTHCPEIGLKITLTNLPLPKSLSYRLPNLTPLDCLVICHVSSGVFPVCRQPHALAPFRRVSDVYRLCDIPIRMGHNNYINQIGIIFIHALPPWLSACFLSHLLKKHNKYTPDLLQKKIPLFKWGGSNSKAISSP